MPPDGLSPRPVPAVCRFDDFPPLPARSERVISSRSFLLALALLASATVLTKARAAPLDADTCNKLMIEQGTLEDAGAEQNMAKGPEWAKANLAPEKIEQVRRFIELEALILFRCRSKSRVTLPPEPEIEDQDKDQGKQAKDGQGKDPQDKSAAGKQENGAPTATAKAKDGPGAATKADPKNQKAQSAKKAGEPKADLKAQPKALPKKEPTDTKQAKSTAQQPKSGPTSSQKGPPPKAKVDEASKAPSAPPPPSPPDANPFGRPFDGAPK
jgi:hypothetical protein